MRRACFLYCPHSFTYYLNMSVSAYSSVLTSEAPRGVSLGPGTGTHSGFFYHYWSDGASSVSYVNKDQGTYAVSWEKCGSFYAGKGWGPSDS
ncbi:hypothetical protein V8F06_013997 [Rhypophila decipiens]